MTDVGIGAERMFAHLHVHDDGRLEPRIDVSAPKGMGWERLQVVLGAIADKVELATPAGEHWLVRVEDLGEIRGRVYLELDLQTQTEADCGMAILLKIVA